ncbi:MAG: hypothetical protein A3K19_06270 [Lentisphaerae bacterium RIFOXYB12_FULL_65_16]|nr:MAG: hypothetical protein A3K18_26775 [Lentisphaerae bacterium RIFOXYA12_64_32]OGV93227.1 MAG: hypothetical protein A3K19_06270 [Lentisphaerae bacterium RIFOXYB12_FULL_65_16]
MTREAPIWKTAKRIDAHAHVRGGGDGGLNREDAAHTLAKGDQLGIDAFCVSYPLTSDSPTPADVRRVNDVVFEAMAASPARPPAASWACGEKRRLGALPQCY